MKKDLKRRVEVAELRLQFALKFAYVDLAQLRPADLANLRDEILNFLSPSSDNVTTADVIAVADEVPQVKLERLQRRVRKFLEDRFSGLRWDDHITHDFASARLGAVSLVAVASESWVRGRPFSRTTILMLDGRFEDCFLLLLGLVFAEIDAKRVQDCPRCRKLYYSVRARKFCSPRCGVSRSSPIGRSKK